MTFHYHLGWVLQIKMGRSKLWLVADDSQESWYRMRRLATGLLCLMAGMYVLARSLGTGADGWRWVQAFAEAAMVGALADWFAVTALFRHPMGIPIPHTAIVAKEKERIGWAVAAFVRKSFFTVEEVRRQWMSWRPVARRVEKFSDREAAERAVRWVVERGTEFLKSTDGKAVGRVGAGILREGGGRFPMGKVAGILLRGFLKSPGRRGVMAPILGKVGRSVAANRGWVMEEAGKAAKPKKVKVFDFLARAAAAAVSGKAVEKFAAELEAASQDEGHALYGKIEEALAETAGELETGESGWWEKFRERLAEDAEAGRVFEEVLERVWGLVVEGFGNLEDDEWVGKWAEGLAAAAGRLGEDVERLARWEERGAAAAGWTAGRFGERLEELIRRTVESWEAEELIERIEGQVGRDLQFIRVNGTLIGGLVGLLLHGLGIFIWGH